MFRPIFCMFALLVLSTSGYAVGFANLPSDREVIFSPRAVVEYPLYVINAESIRVSISSPSTPDPTTKGTVEDDNILDYVSIDDADPDGGARIVKLTFAFPERLKPGMYYVDVWAAENIDKQVATITAVASAKLRFTVRVYASEKLVEVEGFSVPPIAEGLESNATLTVVSRTTQDVNGLFAEVSVEGISGRTAIVPLATSERVTLNTLLDTRALLGGEYDVNAVVFYDGLQTSASTKLKIGTLHVGIPEHTDILSYNTTNRFALTIENQWNRELRDVFAFVSLEGQRKKTASQDISAFGSKEYEVYFDRDAGAVPGQYDVNASVTYLDFDPKSNEYVTKTESFALPITVITPPLEERPSFSTGVVLVVLNGILVFLLVLVLIFLVRGRDHEK